MKKKPHATPEEVERRRVEHEIHKAARKGNIDWGTTDRVGPHDDLAGEVLGDLFGLASFMITDRSELSDFCPRGLPLAMKGDTDAATRAAWRDWIVRDIEQRYRLTVTPDILLADLFDMIEARK